MPRFFTIEYSRVKVRAAARGLTMAQVAARCGTSRQALDIALKGGSPGLTIQERLAGILGMGRQDLFAPLTVDEMLAAVRWYAGLAPGQR
jgi:transcriptional regulator with XRE-family HTH domain